MITGVDMRATVHAWSQIGCSYFVTASGKTVPSECLHEVKHEVEWGNTNFKSIPSPDIIHFCCEHAPFIGEHKKAQQSMLACKRRWSTWNAWFRLIASVTGMCVVDMHRTRIT